MFTIHKDLFAIGTLVACILINQFYFIPAEVISYGSAGTYPYLLNASLALLTICYCLESLRRQRKGMDQKDRLTIQVKNMAKPAGLLLSIWMWAELAEPVGFLIPTALLLVASSLLYGERSLVKISVLSIIAPLFILFFFTSLNSALPEGPLETVLLSIIRS